MTTEVLAEENTYGYSGLTKSQYNRLHERMWNRRPKPEFCEICCRTPPAHLACIWWEYTEDPDNYRWMCRSCHFMVDFTNGVRLRVVGEENTLFGVHDFGKDNPFFGHKHTEGSKQKMRGHRPNMSGAINPELSQEQKLKISPYRTFRWY